MQGQDESGKFEAEPGENDSNECSLLFAGDIYFSNHVLNSYDRVGGIGGVLGESLRDTIAESDIFMANLEFPFSDRGTQAADKQFTFRVSPSRVSILQEIGPDIVTVANNHALDYGTDALLDTCDTLDSAGILHVGAGKIWKRRNSRRSLRKMEKDWFSGRVARLSDGRMGGRIVASGHVFGV
ncbi:MAG: CapA family protein [Clostridium fessum]